MPDPQATIALKVLDKCVLPYLPAYATPGSAGTDLPRIDVPAMLEPGQTELAPTGLAIPIANLGFAALILPRSSLGHRQGIVVDNLVGLIDSDYKGRLLVSCWKRGHPAFKIGPMERLAQFVLVPIIKALFRIVDEFEASARGAHGFGSSGKR